MNQHVKAVAPPVVAFSGGYVTGAAMHKRGPVKNPRSIKRAKTGFVATRAYLHFTPAGQRSQVKTALTGASMISAGHSGYVLGRQNGWKVRRRKYGANGRRG